MRRARGSRKGRIALAAVGLFVFSACKRAQPPPPPPQPAAAMVNGAPIPVSRLQIELDRVRRGDEEAGPTKIAPEDVPRLAHALLDSLIDRAIVLQRAKQAGMSVSDAEVQRAADAMADDARKAGAAFSEQLAKAGQSNEQLSEELRDHILAAKYIADETSKERASPAEVRAWYDTHRAEFETPEEVHCLQIVVRTPDEAKSALDQLRAGGSFDKLARQVSTSPDGRNGGDLGWFPRGQMPKVFDDACFSLPAGRISGVIASPYGYHVFKVLGRRPGKSRTFKEAQAEAERRATADKRAQAERQLLQQLRASAQVKIDEKSLALLH